jgi:hypothetical protein
MEPSPAADDHHEQQKRDVSTERLQAPGTQIKMPTRLAVPMMKELTANALSLAYMGG